MRPQRLLPVAMLAGLGVRSCICAADAGPPTQHGIERGLHVAEPAVTKQSSHFDATFEHCGDQDVERLLQSIEAMKDQIHWLKRPFVVHNLKKLAEHPALPERFAFIITSSDITMKIETRTGLLTYSVTVASDGQPESVEGWTGEMVRASFQIVDGTMVQKFSNDDGSREQRSLVHSSGAKMTTDVLVTSEHFGGAEIGYSLHYCRI